MYYSCNYFKLEGKERADDSSPAPETKSKSGLETLPSGLRPPNFGRSWRMGISWEKLSVCVWGITQVSPPSLNPVPKPLPTLGTLYGAWPELQTWLGLCVECSPAPAPDHPGRSSQRPWEPGSQGKSWSQHPLLKVMVTFTTWCLPTTSPDAWEMTSPICCSGANGQGWAELLRLPGLWIHTALKKQKQERDRKKEVQIWLKENHDWRFAVEEIINQGDDPWSRHLLTLSVKISQFHLKEDIKQICQLQAN